MGGRVLADFAQVGVAELLSLLPLQRGSLVGGGGGGADGGGRVGCGLRLPAPVGAEDVAGVLGCEIGGVGLGGVDQGAPLLLGGLLAVDVEVLAELLGLGGEEPQRS